MINSFTDEIVTETHNQAQTYASCEHCANNNSCIMYNANINCAQEVDEDGCVYYKPQQQNKNKLNNKTR